jgi:hypothetical protein
MGDDPLRATSLFVRRRFAQPERLNLDAARRILIGAAKKPRGDVTWTRHLAVQTARLPRARPTGSAGSGSPRGRREPRQARSPHPLAAPEQSCQSTAPITSPFSRRSPIRKAFWHRRFSPCSAIRPGLSRQRLQSLTLAVRCPAGRRGPRVRRCAVRLKAYYYVASEGGILPASRCCEPRSRRSARASVGRDRFGEMPFATLHHSPAYDAVVFTGGIGEHAAGRPPRNVPDHPADGLDNGLSSGRLLPS